MMITVYFYQFVLIQNSVGAYIATDYSLTQREKNSNTNLKNVHVTVFFRFSFFNCSSKNIIRQNNILDFNYYSIYVICHYVYHIWMNSLQTSCCKLINFKQRLQAKQKMIDFLIGEVLYYDNRKIPIWFQPNVENKYNKNQVFYKVYFIKILYFVKVTSETWMVIDLFS